MLILRTLVFGPAHGHQIAKHIQRTTEDLLQIEHGSLYPALHRLEKKHWIAAKWEPAGKDLKREFKYYRLTAAGKKQLVAEEARWKQLTGTIARVLWPSCRGVCGHYTQIVWSNTREVGCGVARDSNREVWVCNYNPPGNWIGERPY
jgi:PadR family transcriptional regulator